jgi:hypothetical protein
MVSIEAIGFCANYSKQGDWAFDLALNVARRRSLRLNVFHFLRDPYDPADRTGEGMDRPELTRVVVEKEKQLRLYYDARLGDYLDAGFRLCEDPEWTELHRCLCRREFQVLILPCPAYASTFAGKPIESFVDEFVCPVVLVGPTSPLDLRLNSPARLIADHLGLGTGPRPDNVYRFSGARQAG